MVYWQKFNPTEFEYEFDEDELGRHISVDEAVEVFWNGFDVRRNKRIHSGYQLLGYTDGRRLKLVVYEKEARLLRVISGWVV